MMALSKKELSEIHDDWLEELDEHRNPEQRIRKLTDEEKAPIIKYIKDGLKDNGKGVVNHQTLAMLIEKRFGYKISKTTVGNGGNYNFTCPV